MFITRCAWHRRYFGRLKLLKVAWDWSAWWRVTFSDGMCPACAVRVRKEWGLPGGQA